MKRINNILLSMFALLALASCGGSPSPPPACVWSSTDLGFIEVKMIAPSNKPYTYDLYFSQYVPPFAFRQALLPELAGSKIVFTFEATGCSSSTTSKQKTFSIANRNDAEGVTLKAVPVIHNINNITTVMVVAGPLKGSNGKDGYVFWEQRYEGQSIFQSPKFNVTGVYKQDVAIAQVYTKGSYK